ncbi:MAG: M14 family zinc carboxypeptidase [Bacteroidota bacterium]
MEKLTLTLTCIFIALSVQTIFAQNDYFFPPQIQFDQTIPTPQQHLGYPIGEWHTRHERLVGYFKKLAEVSGQATFQNIGYSNEFREQVVLTISSQENLAKLEEIRRAHLNICDPSAEAGDLAEQPVIVLLGYNVHGNEPSGGEAAMLTAYYLLASQTPETENFLKNAVIMIDPVYNPDGRDRHSHWANMHKGNPPVADPLDREHNEVWPGGRTNHYWFDLNRDWLPLSQIESRNRMAFYHRWLPNVATDYHEMGSNATYFFEPTEPFGSENPLVPRRNYDELNNLFADYYEQAMNEIGSLYYTKESYDNSYPGYGSTYPDMQGGLGILFEQASSRGHVQRTTTGDLTFAFTIRNQTRTGVATVRAAVENRAKLLSYQREFFQSATEAAAAQTTRAYLVGCTGDATRNHAFRSLLKKHRIKTLELADPLVQRGTIYSPNDYFLVPTDQPQYRMVQTFFEPVKSFYDSVFYDASAWTVALAFNMDFKKLDFVPPTKQPVVKRIKPPTLTKSEYAYLIDWRDYAAPKALHLLLEKKINVKSAARPFTIETENGRKDFGHGTLLISVADQKTGPDEIHAVLMEILKATKVEVHVISTGRSLKGVDMGSRNFQTIKKPKVIMPIGEGISGYEAGEVWHVLDTRIGMPVTKVDLVDFNRVNLYDYNTLLLVSGRYNFDEKTVQKIRQWIAAGNTLITQRTATKWAIDRKLVKEKIKKDPPKKDSLLPTRLDFSTAREHRGSKRIGGSVYATDLDITHPLGYGFTDRRLPVYRNHEIFIEPTASPFNTVAQYIDAPLLDGYIHPENLEKLKGTASLLVSRVGRGRAILFVDNPNFRGFWYGTNKLFFNAVFFGGIISVPN